MILVYGVPLLTSMLFECLEEYKSYAYDKLFFVTFYFRILLQQIDIIIEKPSSRGLQISLTKSQKLCCINGNLVALCLKQEENVLHCLGYGKLLVS